MLMHQSGEQYDHEAELPQDEAPHGRRLEPAIERTTPRVDADPTISFSFHSASQQNRPPLRARIAPSHTQAEKPGSLPPPRHAIYRMMLSTELPRASAMAGDNVLAGLIARAATGDQAALRSLYERSAGRLFAICLRIVRDPAAAETVLAQAYAAIWERARGFDPAHGSALAWMIAIAREHAIEAVRSRPRDLGILPDAAIDNLEGRIELAGLRRCLADIEEPARRAVLLAYRDGLSYDELGAVLGVPADTVKTWVSRALPALRQYLDDDDEQRGTRRRLRAGRAVARGARGGAARRPRPTDPALAEEIESWNEQLSPLLLDAPEVEPPPAYLFDRIKETIAASAKPQAALAGSRTVRANEGRWEPLCPGIERRRSVRHDRENPRHAPVIARPS